MGKNIWQEEQRRCTSTYRCTNYLKSFFKRMSSKQQNLAARYPWCHRLPAPFHSMTPVLKDCTVVEIACLTASLGDIRGHPFEVHSIIRSNNLRPRGKWQKDTKGSMQGSLAWEHLVYSQTHLYNGMLCPRQGFPCFGIEWTGPFKGGSHMKRTRLFYHARKHNEETPTQWRRRRFKGPPSLRSCKRRRCWKSG